MRDILVDDRWAWAAQLQGAPQADQATGGARARRRRQTVRRPHKAIKGITT